MTQGEYYRKILPSLKQSFERSNYLLAYGRELINLLGFGPYDLPVTVQPVSELEKIALDWNLEVFLPVRGRDAILFPFDFEIALKNENSKLYIGQDSQKHYIRKYIFPVSNFLEHFLQKRKIPYLLDFTPSGGHILFYVIRDSQAWNALQSIGRIERDLKSAYEWTDRTGNDIKRQKAISDPEGLVFSAIGRIAEYIGLTFIELEDELVGKKNQDGLEAHLCDASDRSINIDISWAGDPLYMRIMRAPASLHKKNMNYYQVTKFGPLADAKAVYFDSKKIFRAYNKIEEVFDAQWNLERAADFNMILPGYIPFANEGLAGLVEEYKRSPLFGHHIYFDKEDDMPRGEARLRALSDSSLDEKTISIVQNPNPRMLQPDALKKMVRDFLEQNWHPRHIGNVIRDCYIDPKFEWNADWFKCPAETRANFWARIYSSVFYLENGEPII